MLKHLKKEGVNEIRIPVDLNKQINKSSNKEVKHFKNLVYQAK